MAIENTVSIDFLSTFLDSIGIFDCHLPGVNLADLMLAEKLVYMDHYCLCLYPAANRQS